MAWGPNNKSLEAHIEPSIKKVPMGSPVVVRERSWHNYEEGYKDSWDIERAYKEGVSKVTWVWRSCDAIASNQAKLPMILREDNRRDGAIVRDHQLLKLLNEVTNQGEDAYLFRYRLSYQLLISTRGVFIEVLRDKNRRPIALQILPPGYTVPVPDKNRFVKNFLVEIDDKKYKLPTEDVIWIRRPHPLDPYLSMTPMEPAGVAIEIEMLAKLYNRNFLMNDGRPGGLLVLRGDIEEEDKQELQSRFRGNLARTGGVGVISSEDGADFVDTAASPRDAAYQAMREITKEEILSAFGVPESVLGNASGKTFANALEEKQAFWSETMEPHLMLLAAPLSQLDNEHILDFDISEVPVLVMARQEQHKYLLEELRSGTISINEYREGTGRKKVDSDLADSLLANPNLTPVANTEKPMDTGTAAGAAGGPGAGITDASTAAQQAQVTQFDPATGDFELASEGTLSVELPASDVPSEVAEETESTGGPLVNRGS